MLLFQQGYKTTPTIMTKVRKLEQAEHTLNHTLNEPN